MRQIDDNSFILKEPYILKYDWPDDCFVQGGTNGIVRTNQGHYYTSYFEAFPKNPDCFIRGEGKDLEEAEKNAYEKFHKYFNCPKHEFEKVPGYKNGMGQCKCCGMKKVVFEPDYECIICKKHEHFVGILPKYKTNETDCLCEECSKKSENFKYLSNRYVEHLANNYNGILLINPVMDKKTFEKLKEIPESLDILYEILSEDSNPYLLERIKRLQTTDESDSTNHKELTSLEEIYSYLYENYMERWINKM